MNNQLQTKHMKRNGIYAKVKSGTVYGTFEIGLFSEEIISIPLYKYEVN